MINSDPLRSSTTLGIREITDEDFDPVINLLMRGFSNPKEHWETGLKRLAKRPLLPGLPGYGYLLEANGRPVGVILLISSQRRKGGHKASFSNLSAWYVEPAFRSHATQLLRRALSNKETTYLSISPAVHVQPMYEALGFTRYSSGQVLAVPALARNRKSGRPHIVKFDCLSKADLEEDEWDLIEAQRSYGCIAFCCVVGGQIRPFVFIRRIIKGIIPCAQLAYCRSLDDFADAAGTIGRFLLKQSRPFILVDANSPITGVPGKYFPGVAPKYYKGPATPSLGDVSETEATIFGFASPMRRLAQSLVKRD